MAGPAEGFSNYTLFLNEESNDIVDVPAGATYGSDPSVAPDRQAGYSVALDTKTGAFHSYRSTAATTTRTRSWSRAAGMRRVAVR